MEGRVNLNRDSISCSTELWAEDVIPGEASDCQRCELYQQRKRIIWGEGNPDAPIFVVLDNPGAREDKHGEPFVCGTRQTLYSTIENVGLQKHSLYITYVLRCRPIRKYDKEQARTICIDYLREQLILKKPRLIVCLGNVAAQWYLEDSQATIKELRGRISYYNGTATAFSYHPLAIRRRPVLANVFIEDWQLIASSFHSLTKVD